MSAASDMANHLRAWTRLMRVSPLAVCGTGRWLGHRGRSILLPEGPAHDVDGWRNTGPTLKSKGALVYQHA